MLEVGLEVGLEPVEFVAMILINTIIDVLSYKTMISFSNR